MSKTICLALTGASGMPYGLRLLDCLLAAGCKVQLLYSQAAQVVARQEMDCRPAVPPGRGQGRPARPFPARRPRQTGRLRPRGMVRPGRLRLQPAGCDDRLPVQHGHPGGHRPGPGRQPDRTRRRRGAQGRPQAGAGAARNAVLGHPPRKHAAPERGPAPSSCRPAPASTTTRKACRTSSISSSPACSTRSA